VIAAFVDHMSDVEIERSLAFAMTLSPELLETALPRLAPRLSRQSFTEMLKKLRQTQARPAYVQLLESLLTGAARERMEIIFDEFVESGASLSRIEFTTALARLVPKAPAITATEVMGDIRNAIEEVMAWYP